jgi:hypothetical protein
MAVSGSSLAVSSVIMRMQKGQPVATVFAPALALRGGTLRGCYGFGSGRSLRCLGLDLDLRRALALARRVAPRRVALEGERGPNPWL